MDDELKLTGSEQLTLATRGYKMIKKVNEGSYAKVISNKFLVELDTDYLRVMLLKHIK